MPPSHRGQQPNRDARNTQRGSSRSTLDNHRTARVAEISSGEARQLLEVRLCLDPHAAGLAAGRRTDIDLRAIRAAVRHLRPAAIEALERRERAAATHPPVVTARTS